MTRAIRVLTTTVALGLMMVSRQANAAPEAHLLRIDPQTSLKDGHPVLTTIVDLSESRRTTDVIRGCTGLKGNEQLDCISEALETPNALASAYPFDKDDVVFSVRIEGRDSPARLLSHFRFGQSQDEPRIGTAYLICIDADARMGKALDEAQAVATQFVKSMGPHDWVNIIYLGTNEILSDSGWLSRGEEAVARDAIAAQVKVVPSNARTRPLLDLLKQSATSAFRSLGSAKKATPSPLHQAFVVLSSGYGGGDPSTTGPGAIQLSKYLSTGRFDEENTALPKLPIPVISVFSPPKALAEHEQLARSFMENLANPQIGGFFTVLRDEQAHHAPRIVDTVRTRFSNMIVARFALSCVAPSFNQSFSLLFKGKSQAVVGDNSFSDVPVGIDPRLWPLDIDAELTRRTAEESGGIFPGDTVRIFGNFCWNNDLSRPEVYFIPPGETLPSDLSTPDAAAEIQKRLIALDMRGRTIAANSTFSQFQVPDSDQILHGDGERRVVRVVVVDSRLGRTSGLSEATVLTLKGRQRPLPIFQLSLIGAGSVFFLLLVAILIRKGKQSGVAARPRMRHLADESPYATPAPVSRMPRADADSARATLEGSAGRFVVLTGTDLRCGRDGSRCAAVLPNSQVSGLHATFRMEGGNLLLRDEGSTSGTRIDGALIPPEKWTNVPQGARIDLGPETFTVTISAK